MKKFFTFIVSWLIKIAAVLIVLAAVILGVLRTALLYSEHFRPQLTHWVSQILDQPVKISKVTASWYGFEPVLTFRDVMLYNEAKTQPLVELRQLNVGINLFTSLMHLKVEPGHIVLSGAHLNIYQEADGSYYVAGIKKLSESAKLAESVRTRSRDFLQSTAEFLQHKDQFTLENFSLTLHTKDKKSYHISKFGFSVESGLLGYRLFGVAVLQQQRPAYMRFVIHFHNVGGGLNKLRAEGYLSVYRLAVGQLPDKLSLHGWRFDHGLVSAQIWGKWRQQQLHFLQVVGNASNLNMTTLHNGHRLAFKKLSGNFFFQGQAHGWTLSADKVNVIQQHHAWPFTQFSIAVEKAHDQVPASQTLRFSFLHLADMRRWLQGTTLLPKSWRQDLAQLQPTGELYNLDFKRILPEKNPPQFEAQAQFRNVSIHRLGKIPGFSNLNGSFKFNPQEGQAEIIGLDTALDLNTLFRQPLFFNHLISNLSWTHEAGIWKIMVNEFRSNNTTLSLNAKMGLDLPAKGSGKIDLIGRFDVADMRQASRFLPTKIMPAELVTWLDEVAQGGRAQDGTLIIRGPLQGFPYTQHQGIFKVATKLDNIDFHFAPGWPNLHHLFGELTFTGDSMFARVDRARAFSAKLTNGEVRIPQLTRAVVTVTTKVDADLKVAQHFIAASPLKATLGRNLELIKPSGPMQLDLKVVVPVYNSELADEVSGSIKTDNATLGISGSPFSVSHLQGKLFFTQDSVRAANIVGQFLNQPITINVLTLNKTATPLIEIEAGGQFNIAALAQVLKMPYWRYLSGASEYRALLQIPYLRQSEQAQATTLSIISDLKGIAVKLPPPLAKTAQTARLSQLQLSLQDDQPLTVNFNYGNDVRAAVAFKNTPAGAIFHSGELHFGTGQAQQQRLPGLLISGMLPTIAIKPWQDFFAQLTPKPALTQVGDKVKKTDLKNIIREINFKLGSITLLGQTLAPLHLIAVPQQNVWALRLISPNISGTMTIPDQYPNGVVSGNLTKLFLVMPKTQPTQKREKTLAVDMKGFNLKNIPSINLNVADFRWNNKSFGALDMRLRQQEGILQIDHFTSTTKNYRLSLTGFSTEAGKSHEGLTQAKTDVNGDIEVTNLGGMLNDHHVTDLVEEGKGNVRFALNWMGTIFSPNIKSLKGSLYIHMRDGRIVHLSKRAQADIGIGRVLTLLSLQSLPARLFDIGGLAKKGFHFSLLSGECIFDQGSVFTHNGELKGPVAKVLVRGRIGLIHEDYDLTMQVRPYVTASVPLIATIVGGPIAGGITWVANKILTPEIGKAVGSVYVVTGPWSHPKIEKVKTLKSEHLDLPAPPMLQNDQGVPVVALTRHQ